MLEEDSSEMNILTSVRILSALKSSNETAMAEASVKELSSAQADGKRTASGKLSRVKKSSKSGSMVEDADVEAAPSPRLHLTARTAKDKSRQNSIPTTREASVKLEADGAESVASSTDIPPSTNPSTTTTAAKAGSTSRPSNRLVLTKGEIVFCRHPNNPIKTGDLPDGEGILCRVTAVIGEGKQRRYEVQDADTSSDPPPPQRASVSQLIQIPETNRGLSDLGKGRQVLAQYPDTTTFYKAEVQEAWKDGRGGAGAEWVRLRFEDDEVAREVERRFVLTEK
jgi:SAGA-associated factor 29